MADTREQLAAHSKAGEADLELLLHARKDEEIDRLIERLHCWRLELIALADAHDPVALHFYIVRPELHEVAQIVGLYPELRDDQRGVCNYVETALMQLNKYLSRPDTRPKQPGRPRGSKKYEDLEAYAMARQIFDANWAKPAKARQIAMEVVHLADRGKNEKADFERIYKEILKW